MPMIKKMTGSFPSQMQGTITLKAASTTALEAGRWVYVGANWGAATFKAKVCRYNATTKKVVVKQISGIIAEDNVLKLRNAANDGDAAGTFDGAVAAITTATVGKDINNNGGLDINYGGWNLRETTQGITRSKVVDESPLRVIAEVMIAQRNLSVKRVDIGSIPTFTLTSITSSGPYDVSAGDDITFTITSNEAVKVEGVPTFGFTLDIDSAGAAARTASFTGQVGNALIFTYPVAADDIGTVVDIAVPAGNFGLTGGKIYDVVDGGDVAMTAPVSVTGSTLTQSSSVVA